MENEIMECDPCRKKPGSPILCTSCLHNRELVIELKRKNNKAAQILSMIQDMTELILT